ncbi:MAG TPA: alpha-amylase, partial [Acidimicrobiia bacterium]|nr:alpha-amylase [Acidimicrobiia bacterium]
MTDPSPRRRFPVLWQVNARTAARRLGPDATLDAFDDGRLDELVPAGVDWLYLLGVWQTGVAGREVSRRQPDIRRSCEE